MLFVLLFQEDLSVAFIYSVEFTGELLSHCYDVVIINTPVGRINTAQALGACSRRVAASLYMEPMFSLSVLSLLETINVYK